jgi:hypothetical protein
VRSRSRMAVKTRDGATGASGSAVMSVSSVSEMKSVPGWAATGECRARPAMRFAGVDEGRDQLLPVC